MNAIQPTGEDLQAALERAADLGRRFSCTAAHHDRTGDFPHANFDALHEAGLLGLVTARETGGLGGGLRAALEVIRDIARGEPSTALVLAMHYSQHFALRASGRWPPHLAERVTRANTEGVALLNAAQVEPRVGSPSHGRLPETLARRVGDRWRISGHKSYATGIPLLRWVSVLAVTDEPEPRLGSFLVPADAPGLRVVETWNAAGMRATGSHDILLEEVDIPFEDALEIGPASRGLQRDERLGAWYFTLVPAIYSAVAEAARDWLVAFMADRAPASLGAPLATVPRIQDGIGQIEVQLSTNRRLLRSIAADFDEGIPFGPDAMAVKHVVVENAVAATSLALDLAGNPGLSRDSPLERHHRDALAGRAHAPQNNLVRAALAGSLFRAHAPGLATQPSSPGGAPSPSRPVPADALLPRTGVPA